MSALALRPAIPAMTADAIEKVRTFQNAAALLPQIPIETQHVLHAGLYARTLRVPAGTVVVGVLSKIPTVLTVHGDITFWLGTESRRLTGYHVLTASAGRKQAVWAHEETFITMSFPTTAKTVEEAESEFTDEIDLLASRREDTPNQIIITGED